jgi:hypothetical protein
MDSENLNDLIRIFSVYIYTGESTMFKCEFSMY